MTRFLMILALVFSAHNAYAQSYPEYNSTTVNDYAGLLDDTSEARVVAQLEALKKDTGVEMAVLTLSRQEMFAPDITLEKFATGLFNEWGIGDKISEEDKEALEEAIKEALEWLDENQEAEKDDYDEKKQELESVASPIMQQAYAQDNTQDDDAEEEEEDDEDEL